MLKKVLATLLATSVIVASLAACGGGSTSTSSSTSAPASTSASTSSSSAASTDGASYDKADLKLSTNGTDTANDTKTAKLFADKVSEASNGTVKITVYPNDQLGGGNMSKGLELATGGTVDLDCHSTSIIANLDSRLMVSTLPWIFADYQAAEDAFWGKGGEFVDSVLEPKGLVYLGAVHNGFKAMTCSKLQIKKPADLKGLKIRIPGGDFFAAFYTALGASPQAMSWSEVFTALQQGTIDGHDNSLSTINSANVQEVQKYITITNHTYEAFTFTANKAKFDKMSEANQGLLREQLEAACKEMNKEIAANDDTLKEKFKTENGCEIYELTDEDITEFKAAVADLVEEYKGKYGADACAAFDIK